MHGTARAPAHDAWGKGINHEGYIQPALSSRNIGEVRDPQLVGTIRQVLVGGLKKVDQLLTLTMAAYNLTRLRTLAALARNTP